jgi:Protein of unknown function (DUF1674)
MARALAYFRPGSKHAHRSAARLPSEVVKLMPGAYCSAKRRAPDWSTSMGQRPDHLKPPAYLSKSPPVPKPDPLDSVPKITEERSPTRYGDWEAKGIAVDF